MEIKTKAGIQIEVQTNGSSKIMSFDKPTRLLELTNDESAHVGTLLSMNSKTVDHCRIEKTYHRKILSFT